MVRTIRTTWRKLKNHLADNYADRAVKRAETRRLKAEIATKSLLKEQIALERRHARPDVVVDPTAVPIVFEPDGEHVHACVTAEDLVAVLRRLAPGVIDGVSEIRIGHSTIQMTMRYAHLAPEVAREAVRLLDELPSSASSGSRMAAGSES